MMTVKGEGFGIRASIPESFDSTAPTLNHHVYLRTRRISANSLSGTISSRLGSLQALNILYVIDMEAVWW